MERRERPILLQQNFPLCLDTNLVDPASSHTLVSKIKPCMCKCKYQSLDCEWLIISVIVYLVKCTTWITVVILGLIHEKVLW